MNRLLKIGFVHAGKWVSGTVYSIDYLLDNYGDKNNLLYAFTTDSKIKYIGKTTKKLYERMSFYRNPGERQSTNIRVNALINGAIGRNEEVDIFVFVDNGLLSHGGYHINVAAGIEDSLITAIQPDWNLRGVSRVEIEIADIISDEPDNEEQKKMLTQQVLPIGQTFVTLAASYYDKGFFNVAKEKSGMIGADDSNIEISLDGEEVIIGYINRRSNKSGAPRVMGGVKLRKWIQAHFKKGDVMRLEFLSKQSIKLIVNNK